MERCLMCNEPMSGRRGKVVCSTTCRVNKHKAFQEMDRLLKHFVGVNFNRKDYSNDAAWKRSLIEAIVDETDKKNWYGGRNVGKAWKEAKHPRKFTQLDLIDKKTLR
jgi:hypothetical protein